MPAMDVLRPLFESGASSGFSNVSGLLHEDCPLAYDLSSLILSSSSGPVSTRMQALLAH